MDCEEQWLPKSMHIWSMLTLIDLAFHVGSRSVGFLPSILPQGWLNARK